MQFLIHAAKLTQIAVHLIAMTNRAETLYEVYFILVHRELEIANQLSAVSDVVFIDIASRNAVEQRSFS